MNEANARLEAFARLVAENNFNEAQGELRTGVDLGTANIVLAVVDSNDNPVAGLSYASSVVRDGIVVDYMGAMRAVSSLKARLEQMLGKRLVKAACAIPPGIMAKNAKVMSNVAEGAGFTVTNVVDEPTAAASALNIQSGAVVDVGGGTTGISILKDGEVIFSGDQPTGGTHMTLVLAGSENISTLEAEKLKTDPAREDEVFPIIRPVVEKMASIVRGYLGSYSVETVYVVGGACCFRQFPKLFEDYLGIPVIKPPAPLLVTPLGIAMNCPHAR